MTLMLFSCCSAIISKGQPDDKLLLTYVMEQLESEDIPGLPPGGKLFCKWDIENRPKVFTFSNIEYLII